MTNSNGSDLLARPAGSDTMNSGNGGRAVCSGAGNDSLSAGAGTDTLHRGIVSDQLNGDSGRETPNYNLNENIGARRPVRHAMDTRPCCGHLAGASDSPCASLMCRSGPGDAEKKSSDDSQVDLSEMARRRIAHAAKVTELQYMQAKRICDEICGMPIGRNDPMVMAVLKAISTNYAALDHAAESRTCACLAAAEFDTQIPRFTARSRPGQIC